MDGGQGHKKNMNYDWIDKLVPSREAPPPHAITAYDFAQKKGMAYNTARVLLGKKAKEGELCSMKYKSVGQHVFANYYWPAEDRRSAKKKVRKNC
jgi:hypothetical protein